MAIHHLVDCLAGFFRTEAHARDALSLLERSHGLSPTQVLLLRPADAGWLSFARVAREWAHRPSSASPGWIGHCGHVAVAGALLGELAATTWLALDEGLAMGQGVFACVFAGVAGAVAGAMLALSSRRRPQLRKFDRIVRRQLSAGRWVVLAHDFGWDRQAGSVGLMRERGIDWCAVSTSRHRI